MNENKRRKKKKSPTNGGSGGRGRAERTPSNREARSRSQALPASSSGATAGAKLAASMSIRSLSSGAVSTTTSAATAASSALAAGGSTGSAVRAPQPLVAARPLVHSHSVESMPTFAPHLQLDFSDPRFPDEKVAATSPTSPNTSSARSSTHSSHISSVSPRADSPEPFPSRHDRLPLLSFIPLPARQARLYASRQPSTSLPPSPRPATASSSSPAAAARPDPSSPKVLVIYSGGTIGMLSTARGYAPSPGFLPRYVASVPQLADQDVPYFAMPPSIYGRSIRYDILEYSPLLDSACMRGSDWVRLAEEIEANYNDYSSFLILHGTDTMAYTASALSFLLENLNKTVIITGSQIPLSESRNDALDNLMGALTIAGHFTIPEVSLFFNHRLYRGNRARKIASNQLEAYDTPNCRPLVNVGIHIDVNWDVVRHSHVAGSLRVHKQVSQDVTVLTLFPGIGAEAIERQLAPPTKGCVLTTFGSGNAPDNDPDFLRVIDAASERGVVIVNISQCFKGNVSVVYAAGAALADAGVVPGGDMTPEAALTKLAYLLGLPHMTPVRARHLMTMDLRGELTQLQSKLQFSLTSKHFLSTMTKVLAAEKRLLASSQFADVVEGRRTALNRRKSKRTVSGRPGSARQRGKSKLPEVTETNNALSVMRHVEDALMPVLLCSIAAAGDVSQMREVLASGADVNMTSRVDGYASLHVAATKGHAAMCELLIAEGALLNLISDAGDTPLVCALNSGELGVAQLLWEAGAKLRLTSATVARKLRSFVHDAVREAASRGGQEDPHVLTEMECWLTCGANPSTRGDDGATALHLAASLNAVRAAELLVRHGASLTRLDDEGRSPMALAAVHGAKDVVNLLRAYHAPFILTKPTVGVQQEEADESSASSEGRPIANDGVRLMQMLSAVIVRGDRAHLQTMLAAGIPLDAHDHTGATALHVAAHMGLPHIVHLLLEHGASTSARDMHDNTPLDVARTMEHDQLLDLLSS